MHNLKHEIIKDNHLSIIKQEKNHLRIQLK